MATPTFPRVRPKLLNRLATLKAVPRCSGRFTSVIKANQLGVLADWNAEAKKDKINNKATQGFVKICLTILTKITNELLVSGKSRPVIGKEKNNMYSGNVRNTKIDVKYARPLKLLL